MNNSNSPDPAGSGRFGTAAHGNRSRKEARRGVEGLKTKGSSVLVDRGMVKRRNHKKTYTPEDISSKNSVLEDRLIGGLDNKYDDSVQKLIDIGKEKGYLLYDEVSDLLPPEIGASAEDLDELFSAFGTAQPSFNFSITSRSVQVSIVEEYHLQTDRIEVADENCVPHEPIPPRGCGTCLVNVLTGSACSG